MFLKQFVLEGLGHASYLVGSEKTGEACILDPQREVGGYLAAARDKGLRVRYGIDSHGHNDYLSGLAELAARQAITVLGSAEAELGYDHKPVSDGEVIEMGDVGIQVLHTPGHTPEHVSLLLYDRSAGAEPAILLSGGALLVGDIARPDLLGSRKDAERAARQFCRTIQEKILTLPDHVQVFPTHVAGSLCGGNIGSRLSTTVGYERRTNAVLAQLDSAEGFVAGCISLEDLPAVPPYWKRMRTQNMAGVPLLGVLGEPPALSVDDVAGAQADGAIVLDTRTPEAFGAAHIPNALNVGLRSCDVVHRQRRRLAEHTEQRHAGHVLCAHPLPVGRDSREVVEADAPGDEALGRVELGKHGVGAPLVPDRRREPRADVAPAQASCDMGGEHLDVVGQGEDLRLDGAAELPGRALRVLARAEQVRACDVAHQQRATGEQDRRLGAGRSVVEQQADVLGGVARGVQHPAA